MKGCPWTDAKTGTIAAGHKKSVAQVTNAFASACASACDQICIWVAKLLKAIASPTNFCFVSLRVCSQVCIRWALQTGGLIAAGTGANATSAAGYAHDNLDVFDFELTADEMDYLNGLQN